LATVSGVVTVSNPRNRPDSDVLVNEFGGGEIGEHFPVFDAVFGSAINLTLLKAIELADYHGVHALEHVDEVNGLSLENGVLGQGAELLVAAFGPIANLVVDDVDFLEALLNRREVPVNSGKILVHRNELGVILVSFRLTIVVVTLVNLELRQLLHQLLVIFL